MAHADAVSQLKWKGCWEVLGVVQTLVDPNIGPEIRPRSFPASQVAHCWLHQVSQLEEVGGRGLMEAPEMARTYDYSFAVRGERSEDSKSLPSSKCIGVHKGDFALQPSAPNCHLVEVACVSKDQ